MTQRTLTTKTNKSFVNASGIAHIIIPLGLIVVLLVAFVGYRLLSSSHADAPGAPIVGTSAKCLDIDNNKLAVGTAIDLWQCNGTDAQRWTVSGNTIQSQGYCIGIPGNSKTEDTNVKLAKCDGSTGQVWVYQSDTHTLVNPNSAFCLNVTKNNPDNGTLVEAHHCNGTTAQIWGASSVNGLKTNAKSAGTAISLATWNSEYSNDSDNMGDVVNQIAPNAQIIALQEMHHPSHRTEVRDKLLCATCSYLSNVTDYTTDGSSPASLMILWDRSKFLLVGRPGSLQVSSNTTVNDSAGEKVSDKFINWVRLRNVATGQQFYVLDTHTVAGVEASGKPNTDHSKRVDLYKTHMDKLLAQLKTLQADNIPILVAGDFNVNYRYDYKIKNSAFPYAKLGAAGYRSNFDILNLASISNDQTTEGSSNRLIDYVFAWTRPDTTITSERIGSDKLGSDHHPVYVTATLNTSNL